MRAADAPPTSSWPEGAGQAPCSSPASKAGCPSRGVAVGLRRAPRQVAKPIQSPPLESSTTLVFRTHTSVLSDASFLFCPKNFNITTNWPLRRGCTGGKGPKRFDGAPATDTETFSEAIIELTPCALLNHFAASPVHQAAPGTASPSAASGLGSSPQITSTGTSPMHQVASNCSVGDAAATLPRGGLQTMKQRAPSHQSSPSATAGVSGAVGSSHGGGGSSVTGGGTATAPTAAPATHASVAGASVGRVPTGYGVPEGSLSELFRTHPSGSWICRAYSFNDKDAAHASGSISVSQQLTSKSAVVNDLAKGTAQARVLHSYAEVQRKYGLAFVRLAFEQQFISRSDMFLICESLKEMIVYEGMDVQCNGFRLRVSEMLIEPSARTGVGDWISSPRPISRDSPTAAAASPPDVGESGDSVASRVRKLGKPPPASAAVASHVHAKELLSVKCGLITSSTRVNFKSLSFVNYILLEISKEMWDPTVDGRIAMTWAVKKFLRDLVDQLPRHKASPLTRVVIFGRLEPRFHIHGHVDFFHTVDVPRHSRVDLAAEVDEHLQELLRQVDLAISEGDGPPEAPQAGSTPPRESCTASTGRSPLGKRSHRDFFVHSKHCNAIEAIGLVLEQCSHHHVDRRLFTTGHAITVISAGKGLYQVTNDLVQVTSTRVYNVGVKEISIVCMGRPPLHVTPLLEYPCEDESLRSQYHLHVEHQRQRYYEKPEWAQSYFFFPAGDLSSSSGGTLEFELLTKEMWAARHPFTRSSKPIYTPGLGLSTLQCPEIIAPVLTTVHRCSGGGGGGGGLTQISSPTSVSPGAEPRGSAPPSFRAHSSAAPLPHGWPGAGDRGGLSEAYPPSCLASAPATAGLSGHAAQQSSKTAALGGGSVAGGAPPHTQSPLTQTSMVSTSVAGLFLPSATASARWGQAMFSRSSDRKMAAYPLSRLSGVSFQSNSSQSSLCAPLGKKQRSSSTGWSPHFLASTHRPDHTASKLRPDGRVQPAAARPAKIVDLIGAEKQRAEFHHATMGRLVRIGQVGDMISAADSATFLKSPQTGAVPFVRVQWFCRRGTGHVGGVAGDTAGATGVSQGVLRTDDWAPSVGHSSPAAHSRTLGDVSAASYASSDVVCDTYHAELSTLSSLREYDVPCGLNIVDSDLQSGNLLLLLEVDPNALPDTIWNPALMRSRGLWNLLMGKFGGRDDRLSLDEQEYFTSRFRPSEVFSRERSSLLRDGRILVLLTQPTSSLLFYTTEEIVLGFDSRLFSVATGLLSLSPHSTTSRSLRSWPDAQKSGPLPILKQAPSVWQTENLQGHVFRSDEDCDDTRSQSIRDEDTAEPTSSSTYFLHRGSSPGGKGPQGDPDTLGGTSSSLRQEARASIKREAGGSGARPALATVADAWGCDALLNADELVATQSEGLPHAAHPEGQAIPAAAQMDVCTMSPTKNVKVKYVDGLSEHHGARPECTDSVTFATLRGGATSQLPQLDPVMHGGASRRTQQQQQQRRRSHQELLDTIVAAGSHVTVGYVQIRSSILFAIQAISPFRLPRKNDNAVIGSSAATSAEHVSAAVVFQRRWHFAHPETAESVWPLLCRCAILPLYGSKSVYSRDSFYMLPSHQYSTPKEDTCILLEYVLQRLHQQYQVVVAEAAMPTSAPHNATTLPPQLQQLPVVAVADASDPMGALSWPRAEPVPHTRLEMTIGHQTHYIQIGETTRTLSIARRLHRGMYSNAQTTHMMSYSYLLWNYLERRFTSREVYLEAQIGERYAFRWDVLDSWLQQETIAQTFIPRGPGVSLNVREIAFALLPDEHSGAVSYADFVAFISSRFSIHLTTQGEASWIEDNTPLSTDIHADHMDYPEPPPLRSVRLVHDTPLSLETSTVLDPHTGRTVAFDVPMQARFMFVDIQLQRAFNPRCHYFVRVSWLICAASIVQDWSGAFIANAAKNHLLAVPIPCYYDGAENSPFAVARRVIVPSAHEAEFRRRLLLLLTTPEYRYYPDTPIMNRNCRLVHHSGLCYVVSPPSSCVVQWYENKMVRTGTREQQLLYQAFCTAVSTLETQLGIPTLLEEVQVSPPF